MAIIIILVVVIIAMSIITAFGKAVGAGANVSDLFPEGTEGKKGHEPDQVNRKSKNLRTLGGLLFGVLLLCPILYRHRINGEPFINIDHQVRDYLVGFLVVTELLILIMSCVVNRKDKESSR
ncbi:MAG: hypothetical protein M0T70_06050 [Geobacteraceae bacterium]|nr:hypothetical protein [Geobacteraceae bacterium]